MSRRLDEVSERYLGGQTPREFLEAGGDPAEYARLVFDRQIFGPYEDPAAPDLGIDTVEDLEDALRELLGLEKRLQALEEHRERTQFRPLDPGSPTVLLQVRVPQALLGRVDAAAEAAGVSRSEWVRAALEERLGD